MAIMNIFDQRLCGLSKAGTFSENAERSHLRSNGGTLREDLRFQCPAGILFGIVRRWSLIRTFGGCGPEIKHGKFLPTNAQNNPLHVGPRFNPFFSISGTRVHLLAPPGAGTSLHKLRQPEGRRGHRTRDPHSQGGFAVAQRIQDN